MIGSEDYVGDFWRIPGLEDTVRALGGGLGVEIAFGAPFLRHLFHSQGPMCCV